MTHFWMHENKFSGSLCLTNLPPKFEYLDAANVQLSLSHICADGNNFSPTAPVPLSIEKVHLCESGVKCVVDAAGNPHPQEDEILS